MTAEVAASPSAGKTLLEVRNLSSGYGEQQVLWDVSVEVRQGEIVSLIGANGAGKTTLLCTISKLIEPWAGSIHFDGQDLTHASSDQMVHAGVVQAPQGRRLFPGLSVRDNLLQGAYLRRDKREIQSTLDWVLEILPRLRERLNQAAGFLSGGEQQMCAIGRGLMSKPRLLAIDELSLGLAPLVVDNLLKLIIDINKQGVTVLLVEQDVEVALEYANRGYVLETGHVVQASKASELLQDPRIRQAYLGL